MGKFLLGLIIGAIVGALAMASDPDLLEEGRAGLAEATAVVMRGTERVAEAVGGLAGEAADDAGEAAQEAEREATGEPGAVVEEPTVENPQPPAR